MSKWSTIAEINDRLGGEQTAKGYADADIDLRISKAERRLRPAFVAAVGTGVVALWTEPGATPDAVRELVGDLAAALILQDYGGQSLIDEMTKAGSLWAQVKETVRQIKAGQYTLVDDQQQAVASPNRAFSTTLNKTPAFTMGNSADGSTGTLDSWGISGKK